MNFKILYLLTIQLLALRHLLPNDRLKPLLMTTQYLVMEQGMPLTFDYGLLNQVDSMTW